MGLVGVGLLISHEFIAEWVGEPDLTPLLLVGIAFIIFSALLNMIKAPLWGFEAIQSRAAIHALNHGARLPFALGLVLLGYGALGALVGYILA